LTVAEWNEILTGLREPNPSTSNPTNKDGVSLNRLVVYRDTEAKLGQPEMNNSKSLEPPNKVPQPEVKAPNKWKVKHETLRRNKLLGTIEISYLFSSPTNAKTPVNVAISSSQCSRMEHCGGKGLVIVGSHNFLVGGSGRSRVEQQLAQDFAKRRGDPYGKNLPPDDEARLITDLLESLQTLAEKTVFIDEDT
jgi:hypothetical protein